MTNKYTFKNKTFTIRHDQILVDLGTLIKESSVIIMTNTEEQKRLLNAKMDGVVLAVGDSFKDEYKIGDKVFFPRYSGIDISRDHKGDLIEDRLIRVMSGDLILGCVSEETC